jgi:CBS domain-containing protein
MWTVRDIMQTEVVTVEPQMPVRSLVQVLAKSRISGAPVVGETGEILGVVSATDVMALAAYGSDAHMSNVWDDEEGADDEESQWYFKAPDGPFDFESPTTDKGGSEYLVEDIMTPAAFSVDPDDTIPQLARFLLRGRIHRALVVENNMLVGIATTFDILNAVALRPDDSDLAMAGV